MAPCAKLMPMRSRCSIIGQVQSCSKVFNRHRFQSTVAFGEPECHEDRTSSVAASLKQAPPLSLLPLPTLLRSLLLSSIFSTPALLKPSLYISGRLASSKSPLLNPDRNVFLRMLLKPLVYNHFCAGTNEAEVKTTIASLKRLGFSGIALCHGKELLHDSVPTTSLAPHAFPSQDVNIESWKNSLLQTLNMVSAGDTVAIKFSGAGTKVTTAMEKDAEAPEQFWAAIQQICDEAVKSEKVLWIDAEKQLFQHTIDRWTIELMRKYNHNGRCTIYNTIQCYLKASADNVSKHVQLAQKEGWNLGLKLVRGAYIDYEDRSLIHDTKEETDTAFDDITENLLRKRVPGVRSENFPPTNVFLASHNAQSIEKASFIARELALAGQEVRLQGCGQLLGMADEIGCKLVQDGDAIRSASGPPAAAGKSGAPRAFKYLTWGSVQECMGYLHRRAVENSGATARIKEDFVSMRIELWRRMTASLR